MLIGQCTSNRSLLTPTKKTRNSEYSSNSRVTTLQSETPHFTPGRNNRMPTAESNSKLLTDQAQTIRELRATVRKLEKFIGEQTNITEQLYKDKFHLADQVLALKGRTPSKHVPESKSSECLQKTKSSYRIATQEYYTILHQNTALKARLEQLEQNDANYQKLISQKVNDFIQKERLMRERLAKLEALLKEKLQIELKESMVEEYAAKLSDSQQHISKQAGIILQLKKQLENNRTSDTQLQALKEQIRMMEDQCRNLKQELNRLRQNAVDTGPVWKELEILQARVGRNQTDVMNLRESDLNNDLLAVQVIKLEGETRDLQQNVHDVSGDFSQAIIDKLLEMQHQVFDLGAYMAGNS